MVNKLDSKGNTSTSTKNRNDPGRFFGDGVTFKAKLIGILEVGEARGDRMCQEALQDLKMAIRAAGEHKQRITIHVTIDGLRLRDEKTGDSLYHHPVHKISFIAQDMTDSRAFGYIFGSPDSGHRFFGIKTDKAASQVVLAMRDLFQVVFELKKKEIEMARQQIQSKTIHEHQPLSLSVKNAASDTSNLASGKNASETSKNTKEMSPESVADLVDLEQELSSIQRGITQMERITPSEPTAPNAKNLTEEDPFGDSFTNFPTYNLLPPPESTRSRHSKPNKPPDAITEAQIPNFAPPQPSTTANITTTTSSLTSNNWLEHDDVVTHFETTKSLESNSTAASITTSQLSEDIQQQKTGEDISKIQNSDSSVVSQSSATKNQYIDAFTDLDPLGTGKSKPYIDKKYFFQELKNPPKKVLKDLSGPEGSFTAFTGSDPSEIIDVFDKSTESFEVSKPKGLETKANEFPAKSFTQTSLFPTHVKSNVSHNDKIFNIDLEHPTLEEPVMMSRDTDPFSPTRKKSDPFQDGDIFSKLDPFEFELPNKSTVLPDTKIISEDPPKHKKDTSVFNGPLQVNLPPESWSSTMNQKRIERQTSESPTSTSRNRPSVFKQNTVDVISSISSKKMPHLFGQKFSKRDSNSINMRRLQESDSLSENETAPEPPPRPESATYIEPPPLPPKKQFSDIVIRPRITSSSAIPPPIRYDYVTARMKSSQSVDTAPPIPLPSRKIARTDSSFPGPGRPGRKPGEEEDYLTPITVRSDVPPLLPPPQTKSRGRRLDHIEQKVEVEQPVLLSSEVQSQAIIPDITLSQLLTLGIDELAVKLNVPTSKLSTMTLVELTTYLSDFIESSKKKPAVVQAPIEDSPVFKVNFDQNSDATFVAKFDDNFGEESNSTFVANFSNFNDKPEENTVVAIVPPADRYAVLREIIEQDMKCEQTDQSIDILDDDVKEYDKNEVLEQEDDKISPIQIPKIDTKITEAISHAKDRYAALRDIILVEDLFEKPQSQSVDLIQICDTTEDELTKADEENVEETEQEKSGNEESSPDSNNYEENIEANNENNANKDLKPNGIFLHTLTVSNKDDLEIDELMNRAISNISLESREHLSPNVNKSPLITENTSISPPNMQLNKSPISLSIQIISKSQFNDVSTSPIPLQKSPAQKSPLSKSPLTKSPASKSPIPQSTAVTNLIDANKRNNSGSLSDVVCGSSPEADGAAPETAKTSGTPGAQTESWAIFDKPTEKQEPIRPVKSPKTPQGKEMGESPCSSDGKDDWKAENEYNKRWPKGHTSSSSRDLSPWDDEAPDYKKRIPPGADRQGYYMRHARRMNSCDDDYEYEEEMSKRRDKKIKTISRSRENFDLDTPNWYQSSNHHNWSPPDEERPRPFERAAYERSTYGPPYDKRDHKTPTHPSYDRRDYKNYDKRKYFREYARPEYDFETYGESPDAKDRKMIYYDNFEKPKCRRDYENIYEENFTRDGRVYKSREYFYDRERKSFDRDSVESYESATRRHKSFGSGEVYGSLDSREEFRERYLNAEKTRSLRKGIKIRGSEEYEQDSESDMQPRRGDTKSLQRPPQSSRMRKSSGSSPWDGEEPPPAPGQKGWKRPSSASESERRLAENRRVLCHTLSGSDGEKERRFRRKQRFRGKEVDARQQNIPAGRYPVPHRDGNYDYIDYDEYEQPMDEDKFERLNRRRHEMHQRMLEAERRRKGEKYSYDEDEDVVGQKFFNKKEGFYSDKDKYSNKFDAFEDPKSIKPMRCEFDFDDFEDTPRSNTSSNKFNFEEHGFESDFNSPPPPTTASSGTKSSFRFSNDFSEKDKQSANYSNCDSESNQTPTQKLRFDDKVTISKFENDQPSAFEDDFSKADFLFESEDQWNPEQLKKNNLRLTKRQENIKKSESVNIFARKSEDPFEDDDFFKTTSPSNSADVKKNDDESFQWDNNFAKFDENM